MDLLDPALQPPAERIAEASMQAEYERTGHRPISVNVITGGADLIITLNGALSEAELETVQTPAGAAKVQEYHRQLFLNPPQLLTGVIWSSGLVGRGAGSRCEQVE